MANKLELNHKDRDSVIIVIYVIALFFGSVIMFFTTKQINPAIIGILMIVLEVFFLVPKLDRLYLKVLGFESPGWKAFLPIWNELMVFPTTISMVCTVLWIINVIVFAFCFIPGSVLVKIFGFDFAYNFTPYLILVALIIFLLNSITRGIGFNSIRKNASEMKADATGTPVKPTFFKLLQAFTLYLPIFRILGLMMINDILYKLVELDKYVSDGGTEEFQEED